jgi:hypothetical protein
VYFKVVKKIDYSSPEWHDYIIWRNYNFEKFESVDTILNESLFTPETEEDWLNVYHEDFMTDIITNFDYANNVKQKIAKPRIQIFCELEEDFTTQLLGYDILDREFSYSLLTNFGNDIKTVNSHLSKIGLIKNLNIVEQAFEWFQKYMNNDSHVFNSKIVKVFSPI